MVHGLSTLAIAFVDWSEHEITAYSFMEFAEALHLKGKSNFMKTYLNLSIPKPCTQKWETFTAATQGGYCESCNSVVVDFTKMTDQEIFDFFDTSSVHTCGRLRPDQVKAYSNWQPSKINPGLALLRAGLVCLFFVLIDQQSSAQTTKPKIETVQDADQLDESKIGPKDHLVRGIVTDEIGEPMVGVNVYLKDATVGTVTGANGEFEFPRKLADGDRLTFSFIGYESMEYVVRKNEEGVIALKMTLNVDIMGEVVVDEVYTTKTGIRRWWSGVKKLF